jgi:hypothetical protein
MAIPLAAERRAIEKQSGPAADRARLHLVPSFASFSSFTPHTFADPTTTPGTISRKKALAEENCKSPVHGEAEAVDDGRRAPLKSLRRSTCKCWALPVLDASFCPDGA